MRETGGLVTHAIFSNSASMRLETNEGIRCWDIPLGFLNPDRAISYRACPIVFPSDSSYDIVTCVWACRCQALNCEVRTIRPCGAIALPVVILEATLVRQRVASRNECRHSIAQIFIISAGAATENGKGRHLVLRQAQKLSKEHVKDVLTAVIFCFD